jgi:hypothetical protein
MQRLIRAYKDETSEREIDMHKVAKFAAGKGWPLPLPPSPLDLLAKQFSDAAREEIRHDKKTGRPYRANHAIIQGVGSAQLHLWIDIDEAPRDRILKSLVMRREQMVGDGLQLSLDQDHWNSINPKDISPSSCRWTSARMSNGARMRPTTTIRRRPSGPFSSSELPQRAELYRLAAWALTPWPLPCRPLRRQPSRTGFCLPAAHPRPAP